MFDVGDLPVPTFGNYVLKTGVIKWPRKLYIRFYIFFKIQKNMTFYFFELLHMFSPTQGVVVRVNTVPVLSVLLLGLIPYLCCMCCC